MALGIVLDPGFHIDDRSVRCFHRFIVTVETEVHLLTHKELGYIAPVGVVAIGALIFGCDGFMGHDNFFDDFANLFVAFHAQNRHILLELLVEIAAMGIMTR